MNNGVKLILALIGLLLFLPESKKSSALSELQRKSRSRRLFYVSNGKVIPRSEIETAKRMARSGYGKVYAVWAYNADEAREYIGQGKAESISGIGYKGYDEEGAINATIKNIDKFQGKPAYIAATYTGIKATSIKPPFGQQYYRVNPDGSVDYIQHLKGKTSEERIRNPKYKTIRQGKAETVSGLSDSESWRKNLHKDESSLVDFLKESICVVAGPFCVNGKLKNVNPINKVFFYESLCHRASINPKNKLTKIAFEELLSQEGRLKAKGQMTLFGRLKRGEQRQRTESKPYEHLYDKMPYEMTDAEWEKEKDKIHPENIQTDFTKASASQEVFRAKKSDFLNYNTPGAWDPEFKEFPATKHRDIVLKAMVEGKDIPGKVLNEHPDIKAMSNDQLDNEYLNAVKDHIALKLSVARKASGDKLVKQVIGIEELILPLNVEAKYKLKKYIDKNYTDGFEIEDPQLLRRDIYNLTKFWGSSTPIIDDFGKTVDFTTKKQRGNLPRSSKLIPEQASFTERSQMTLFGALTKKALIKKYSRPNEEYTIEEILDRGHKINDDGTMVLYHATTADKSAQIKKTGILKRPADAPDDYGVYLSTSPAVSESYGDGTVVKVKVKVRDLYMDDIFPDGRIDFRIPTKMGSFKPINISGLQMTLFGGFGRLSKTERERIESFTRYNENVEKENPRVDYTYKGTTKSRALKAIGYKEYPDIFETRASAKRIADDLPNSTIIGHGKWIDDIDYYSVWYKEQL